MALLLLQAKGSDHRSTNICRCLAAIGDPIGVPFVVQQFLKLPASGQFLSILLELMENAIGEYETLPIWRAAVHHPFDTGIRKDAMAKVGQLRDASAVDLLASALDYRLIDLAQEAALALGRIGGQRAGAVLAERLRRRCDTDLRKTIEKSQQLMDLSQGDPESLGADALQVPSPARGKSRMIQVLPAKFNGWRRSLGRIASRTRL